MCLEEITNWNHCNNKTVLCRMTQYSIRPKRSSVYLLHSTMPSVTCLRLSDVSVIWRVTHFSFQCSLLFFHISVARQHQHCGYIYEAYSPGVKTLHWFYGKKMKTRHPIKGYFVSEFPALCNHGGVMTAWSRKT